MPFFLDFAVCTEHVYLQGFVVFSRPISVLGDDNIYRRSAICVTTVSTRRCVLLEQDRESGST